MNLILNNIIYQKTKHNPINNQYKINKEINVLIGDYDKMSVSNSVCILESMGLSVTIAKSAIEIMEKVKGGHEL